MKYIVLINAPGEQNYLFTTVLKRAIQQALDHDPTFILRTARVEGINAKRRPRLRPVEA